MPASKIQDEQEVIRWFQEGKTYQEMCDIYREKYNIETVPSLWGNFRRRRGLSRRSVLNDALIPWSVKPEHRSAYPLAMLRVEGRKREGLPLRDHDSYRLGLWLKMLETDDLVVHYDPDTEVGFFYIKRLPGDTDLIHAPEKSTKKRVAVD